MKKIYKLIILWFVISWPLLLIITLKPVGLKNTFIKMLEYFKKDRESIFVLCDFKEPQTLYFINFPAALVDIEERGLKVKFLSFKNSKQTYPRIFSENYDIGPFGKKDWSFFTHLRTYIINLSPCKLRIHLKIKDISGRFWERLFCIKEGETRPIQINLINLRDTLDLSNIVSVNFYSIKPSQDLEFILGPLILEKRFIFKKEPLIKLHSVKYPHRVKRGKNIEFSISFVPLKKLKRDYVVFIHIFDAQEKSLPSSKKRYFINADRKPQIPTSKWVPFNIYEIGPLQIYIPKNFPQGKYLIEAGLFNPLSKGGYCKECANDISYNYKRSFVRINYQDKRYKEFIVGKFYVE